MEISIDAPNLLSFSYKGELNSHLLSTSLSGKSKSRIGVSHSDDVDAYWFHNLWKFLFRINHLEILELQIMFGKVCIQNYVSELYRTIYDFYSYIHGK